MEREIHFHGDSLRKGILLVLTAVAILLCLGLAAPFTPAIIWSMALAVVSNPLHAWVEGRFPGRRDLAALGTTAIVTIGLLGPLLLLLQQLVQEAKQSLDRVGEFEQQLGPALVWINSHVDLQKEMQDLAGMGKALLGGWIRGVIWTATQLLVTIFLLFYILRDRGAALDGLRSYLPLSPAESDRVLQRVRSMVHATIFGTLTVSLLQGFLGGLMFWFLGIPGAVLWGGVMAILAIIPVVGTFIVWVPAAAILAGQGNWGKAAILMAWGLLVVSLVDNLLYPILVGSEIKIHTALVFMAIAGGLILFGVSGLVLGPVILVVALALTEVVSSRSD